jgi:hypothetical protein
VIDRWFPYLSKKLCSTKEGRNCQKERSVVGDKIVGSLGGL